MKRIASVLSVCLVLTCVMMMVVMPVSAATPKEEIIAAAKAAIPEKYHGKIINSIENVLQQIEVTPEQAKTVIEKIDTAKAAVKTDKGESASEYTEAEREAVLEEFGGACETLGLTYEIRPAANPTHEGDVDCVIKVANTNKQVAVIDQDVVKTTNVPEAAVDYTLIVAAAGVAVLAAIAAVGTKKVMAAR